MRKTKRHEINENNFFSAALDTAKFLFKIRRAPKKIYVDTPWMDL
jgi:hypothetical protein